MHSIAQLSLSVIDVICTVAGYLNGKKKIQRRGDIYNFHLLTNENKEVYLNHCQIKNYMRWFKEILDMIGLQKIMI